MKKQSNENGSSPVTSADKKDRTGLPVSKNNPCPYLRALVAQGLLADDEEPLDHLTNVILKTARSGEGAPELDAKKIKNVATIANGIGPLSLLRTLLKGVRLNQLRGGPLDKKGAGSRVLNSQGKVRAEEVARMAEFGSQKSSKDGGTEIGLDAAQVEAFLNANFARAKGQRRFFDRKLMEGEWPILLEVMGREGPDGRYLSVRDVEKFLFEHQFPEHMKFDF